MDEPLRISVNDYGYEITFTCTNEDDGSEFDFTPYNAIYFVVWEAGQPNVVLLDGVCASATPASGVCTYTLVEGDFTTVGNFSGEIQVTKSDDPDVRLTLIPFAVVVAEVAKGGA